ncbi:F-box/FBD/LRR-repeat protein [Pyrus ussuriensis x Pyrus communis]|uniref:F-box/FBD/LRR-repeat protein n=1 Tax=Pyrus ussuriensis x Pyrus communis TaxID=2448454 RepID=A0A5N5F418_9ROSA|nr:F-box/FBD/LRR-repeat protein [Pyrus ussuriensis x Pyrus communis]
MVFRTCIVNIHTEVRMTRDKWMGKIERGLHTETNGEDGLDCITVSFSTMTRKEGKQNHGELGDRISELPHEIIVSILSLMSLKETAATSLEIPNLGASCGRFEALKVLHVYKVSVTGEFLEYLLSNCPSCRPSIALKHLAIHSCHYLKSIEIHDVNLVSFHYNGKWTVNLALGKTPSLVEISRLSSCSQLEILELDTNGVDDYIQTHAAFPIITNLKHLKLLVNACPYLQRLVLKRAAKCPHNYVKVLEILGYPSSLRRSTCQVPNRESCWMEKIIVDPVVRLEAEARDHAMQNLKQKVPSTVEFVCN